MKRFATSALVTLLAFVVYATPALAQTPFDNPLHSRSLMQLLGGLMEGVVYVGTVALLIGFVWTGALFVFAQGAEEKLKEARRALMWTLVGGVVLLGAEGIARILEATASRL